MSDARILHKKAGLSAKVSALSDFEYRVWSQYVLSSDDYGVMPAWAHVLQADNAALRRRSTDDVQRALEMSVAVTLLGLFTHQEERFVWSLNWQDFQGIRYPRLTVHPMPPPDLFATATKETRDLFKKHPKYSRDQYGRISETSPPLTGAGGRETHTQTLTPTQEGGSGETPFEAFWTKYPRKVAKQAALSEWRRRELDEQAPAVMAGLERALASAKWQTDMREPDMPHIPHARTWLHQLRWTDELSSPPAASASLSTSRISPDVQELCASAGINRHNTYTWFPTAVLDRDGDVITLVITDADHCAYVSRHFSDAIEAAILRRGAAKLVITNRRAA